MTSIVGRSTGFTSGERSSPIRRAKRVWEYRRILWLLIGRDLKVRYAGSMLGYVWSVLDPLAMAAVYWFLFTQIITRKIGFPPYILFLVAGQLAFHWIQAAINGSVSALRSEAQFVRSSSVPRELWVLRLILSKGVEYVFSLPVLAIFSIGYQKWPTKYIGLLPLAVVMTIALSMGIGMILAPAAVLVRDLQNIVRIIMRAIFFLSPVLYSLHDVQSRLHNQVAVAIVSWNPISGIMSLYRAMFFPQELDWADVGHSAIVIGFLLVIGVWAFNRLERPMLKEI
jgi:ABC-2 type transport system permease protein